MGTEDEQIIDKNRRHEEEDDDVEVQVDKALGNRCDVAGVGQNLSPTIEVELDRDDKLRNVSVVAETKMRQEGSEEGGACVRDFAELGTSSKHCADVVRRRVDGEVHTPGFIKSISGSIGNIAGIQIAEQRWSSSGVRWRDEGSSVAVHGAACTPPLLILSISDLLHQVLNFDRFSWTTGSSKPKYRWKMEAIEKCDVMVYTKIFLKFPYEFWPCGHKRRGYYTFWQKDNKVESKASKGATLNELVELKGCSSCLFFERRKHKDLYLWMAKCPNGPSMKFLVNAGDSLLQSHMILLYEIYNAFRRVLLPVLLVF
ncbi:hypothetical protein ACSBR1_012757 [Camellia fascicularis]